MTGLEWLNKVGAEAKTLAEIELHRVDETTHAFAHDRRIVVLTVLDDAHARYIISESNGGPIEGRLEDRVTHLRPQTITVGPDTVTQMAHIIASALSDSTETS